MVVTSAMQSALGPAFPLPGCRELLVTNTSPKTTVTMVTVQIVSESKNRNNRNIKNSGIFPLTVDVRHSDMIHY